MSCDSIIRDLPLYLYGELAGEAEERLEEHCSGCTACGTELRRQKKLGSFLDRSRADVHPALLAECRAEFARRMASSGEIVRPQHFWARWHDWWHALLHTSIRMSVPVGAMALVAMGYFGARLTPGNASGLEGVVSSVRSVEPDQSGSVRISLDETRRKIVSGRLDDPGIQRMLLTAVRDEANPGVRVESMALLRNQAGSTIVRQALLEAVAHDPNPGVRLKALDGLNTFAADPAVRRTLSRVLLDDSNPGVRIRVIDLLVAHHDEDMVGVLQNLVRKEDNSYVRARCENALQDLNASVGTF